MRAAFLEALNRLRDRLRRDRLAADLDDELRFHRAMIERDHRALGLSEEEARRQGRLQLGNLTYLKEETRNMWSLGWFDDALADVRYASRVLRRNFGFTVAVVLTLALGIGANTALFSVVNAVVLRPLPYSNPDELYSIWTVPIQSPTDRNPTSYPDLKDWQTQSTAFASMGGYAFNRFEISSSDGVEMARAIVAMPSVYTTLGAKPLIGRLPRPDEENLAVVAISHRLWQRRFGGDPGVIGRTVVMNEEPFTIVGVMPRGFQFPTPDVDMWMSMYALAGSPGRPSNGAWITNRGLRGYRVVARLKPGVTPAAAEAQMNTIMDRLGEAFPEADGGTDIKLQSIRDDSVKGVQRALWLMLGAAGLVLLLACANVAHLMLARTSTRSREIAVRRALGAHRGRVVRQLLTESILLGTIGGAVGLAVAALGIRILVRLSPGDIPRLETVGLDATTIGFALIVSILTGVLFGLAPAMVAWSSGVQSTLREQGRGATGGRHGGRVRAMLTAAEVAFALMLLVGAGLMVRSFASMLDVDLGFRREGVVTFHIPLPANRYPTPSDRVALLDRVLDRVRSVPGIASAGASTSMPPIRMQQANGFMIDGDPPPKPNEEAMAIYVPTTPDFHASLGVPLVSGRHFTSADNATSPRVTIISKELARRHFANRNPIGHRLRVEDSLRTIVGVVGDVPFQGVTAPTRPTIYVPFSQSPSGGAWIAVKTTMEPAALIEPIRSALRSVDPLMNPRDLRPMDQMIGETMVRPRFQAWLLTTFGALALVLAAVGIYGVIAYSVVQRTSEIGLRLALGAPPSTVVGLIIRRGMMPVVLGLVVGLAGAFALSGVMTSLLFGITPTDAMTFIGVTFVLGSVAVAAAYVPALRAARLDPLSALRSD
jgi:putative ABC transport system permease protein